MFSIREVLVAANSKKYKPKNPPSFHEYAPKLRAFATGEEGAPIHDNSRGVAHDRMLASFGIQE